MNPKEFITFCEKFAHIPAARDVLGALDSDTVATATPNSLAALLLIAVDVNATPFTNPNGKTSIAPSNGQSQSSE